MRVQNAFRPAIVANILMPTSVHLPKRLLETLDRRARALRISRNKLITQAIERELSTAGDWSPGFFDRLGERDDEVSVAVDQLLEDVVRTRRSKVAPGL
jgi:predicted transcriptional regulator